MQRKDRYIIIMAGGRGERFWPVSRERKPKQLITLLADRSFLQQTVDRVKPVAPLENILIITNAVQAAAVRRQLPELPRGNIIGEPCGRDTCAAVALGAALVGARSGNGVMAVLPADHVIPDEAKFRRVLIDSMALAKRESALVTIGIQPQEPATGYGYIQVGNKLAKSLKSTFFTAKKFVEKPNLAMAKRYLKSGNYRWNAGMFIWSHETIAAELCRQQPRLFAAAEKWRGIRSLVKLNAALARDYPKLKKISVDYAIMENALNIVCADGVFGWDDLGSWPALARHLKPDAAGNCTVGDLVQVDSANNVVFDARTRSRAPIALVGISEMIVVLADDAMLVARKSESQKI
ncbi:MAG: sugar phosphate nucleotidyltransferase, partial [Verrucomicrobiota bacterium]|nr:sugar phosphate nucleotidyltransferase [Verrucomicrobiota bacterium]